MLGFLYTVQKKEGIFRMQNSAALSQSLSPYIFIPYRTGGGTAPYAAREDARIPLHCSKERKGNLEYKSHIPGRISS
jgi:hypothetical protein